MKLISQILASQPFLVSVPAKTNTLPPHPPRQVSQAVLLDNFVQATARIEGAERGEALQRQRLERRLENPLDPLLERLVRDHVDDGDLSARIRAVFKVCVNKLQGQQAWEGRKEKALSLSLLVRVCREMSVIV